MQQTTTKPRPETPARKRRAEQARQMAKPIVPLSYKKFRRAVDESMRMLSHQAPQPNASQEQK